MASPLFADYYRVEVTARCEIGGKQFPVSAFSLNYGINMIPACSLKLPIGRVAGGAQFNTVSAAMSFLSNIGPFTTLQIFATLKATPGGRGAPPGKPLGFPDGDEFLVFDGFVKSPIFERTTTSASITIEGMGKTAALAGTTQFVTGTVTTDLPNGAAPVVSFFGTGGAAATLMEAVIESTGGQLTDLWTDVIKVLLEEATDTLDEWSEHDNGFAKQAIERINVGEALPKALLDASIPDASEEMVAKCIISTTAEVFWDAWSTGDGTGDLWTALIALSPMFGFKYITAIEEDGILPVTFGLGGNGVSPWRTLSPDEYSVVRSGSTMDEKFYSYITQVGLFTEAFQSSPWQGSGPAARQLGFAEVSNKEAAAAGRLLLVRAPSWLVPFSAPGQTTVNPGNAVPDASNPTEIQVTQNQGQQEQQFLASGAGDDYAASVLYDRIFEHRWLNISGRLRFDIAPGSLIKLVTPGESFTGEDANLWGHVAGVIITISDDGPTGSASTSFQISHVRTDKEQASLTTEDHPFFGDVWVGGKLSSKA